MQICDYHECTGCFACMNQCPRNAIMVITDKLGKTIPEIQNNLCVDCGACRRVCPVMNPVEKHHPMNTYAVWSTDLHDVKTSSSGGAAAVLAGNIIDMGGAVYGASSIDGTVKHIKIETRQDFDKLRGSKYVQSDIGIVYREIKKEINEDRWVLFIGTPCQVAGLYRFVGEDRSKLVTVDLICHGTPPLVYLEEHLKTNHVLWNSVSFRGERNYQLVAMTKQNEVVYQRKSEYDEYFTSFLKGLIFRDNCYHCQYACSDRIADLTIGDFWGIDRKTLTHPYDGRISLILVNTENGRQLFEKSKNQFVWEERTLDEAMNPSQTNLLHPSEAHKDRDIFVRNYPKYGFEKAVRMTPLGKRVRKNRFKAKIKQILGQK